MNIKPSKHRPIHYSVTLLSDIDVPGMASSTLRKTGQNQETFFRLRVTISYVDQPGHFWE